MCLCDLLVSLPHFNFRNNILATLVPLMPSKALNGKVRWTYRVRRSTPPAGFHTGGGGPGSFPPPSKKYFKM